MEDWLGAEEDKDEFAEITDLLLSRYAPGPPQLGLSKEPELDRQEEVLLAVWANMRS